MSDTIIRVENLGKKYIIGRNQEKQRYTALRDVIVNSAKGLGNRFRGTKGRRNNSASEEFWALKDVSFEIKQGDRVGIIGRNGAGKSTLLKILSRITEPTEGQIAIKGRVASLLEVGTGFHPELTGRENVYLNGAILGMSKAEIRRKFDEIIAFAEVEKFIDTPVKRYSSGMYVRLAFAVAANLEPEILVVDEVLSVGDVQFQKKCLGKMEDVSREGRTVLFVSHNLFAIRALCTEGILLKQGSLIINDSIENTIQCYSDENRTNCKTEYVACKKSDKPCFLNVKLVQEDNSKNVFRADDSIRIKFELDTKGKSELVAGIVIRNSQDLVIHHGSDEFNKSLDHSSPFRECIIPPHALSEGDYYVDISLAQRNQELFESINDVLKISVTLGNIIPFQTKASDWKGICSPGALRWS